ncbi:MAG: hypothetical protein OHK0046_33770 [Anaerolineae bacterium]
MAQREDLIEAFNTCIDRLNEGETVEAILTDYPAFASQLRPMLEAGLLFPRMRYPALEVQQAESAGEAIIQQTIQSAFRSGPGWLGGLVLLLIVGGLVGVLAVVFSGGDTSPTATATATLTLTSTETPTLTPTHTNTSTLTSTSTVAATTLPPTLTPASSATPAITLTVTAAAQITITAAEVVRAITIEGPVNSIEGSIITIFDLPVLLEPDDPLLTVLQVGDVIRVTGDVRDEIVQVVDLVFLNVTVVVDNGQIWRGDDCANPPPDWAQPQAADWMARCAPPPAPPANNPPSGGGSGGDDDDDD